MQQPQPPAKNVASTTRKKSNVVRWLLRRSLPVRGASRSRSVCLRRREGKSIAKLTAEIRHNQRRIEQLQQRNVRLTHNIQAMSRKPPPQPGTSSSRRSAPRKSRRKRSPKYWLSILLMCAGIAIVGGIIGFAVMRLVAVK